VLRLGNKLISVSGTTEEPALIKLYKNKHQSWKEAAEVSTEIILFRRSGETRGPFDQNELKIGAIK
jgi:hypothetical protein